MKKSEHIKLIVVGDLMLGDQPACIGHGIRSKIQEKGFAYLFNNVAPYLQDCDILFGNLETVLSDKGYDPDRLTSAELRGHPAYAEKLAQLGFNVMSVANNHAMQYGSLGFRESVEALQANGIYSVGIAVDSGESNCFNYRGPDFEIVIIAYSLRPDNYEKGRVLYAVGDESVMLRQIQEKKSSGKIVIVSLHWGEEYLHRPSPKQIRLAHAMVEHGADLIVGHHPHVLQGVEQYNKGYIAYSLGNFIADFWQDYARKTAMLECMIGKQGIESIAVLPLMINQKYQLTIPESHEMIIRRAEMRHYQQEINNSHIQSLDEEMHNYDREARRAYRRYRLESYAYFLRNIYRYKFWMIVQSARRFVSRRFSS